MPAYIRPKKGSPALLDRDWLLVSAESQSAGKQSIIETALVEAPEVLSAEFIRENKNPVRPMAPIRSHSALDALELQLPRRPRTVRAMTEALLDDDFTDFDVQIKTKGEADNGETGVTRSKRAKNPHFGDELDRLIMRDTPQLQRPASEGHRRPLRIAIYARFSSKAQKESSIKQQVGMCSRYIEARFQMKKFEVFADRAKTGTNMDREEMEKLKADVQAGEIDVVVFYAYDRVARETFDGVEFFKVLEEQNVELHCARSERRFTKEDATRAAIEAENDSKLRRERSMNGLDSLVSERKGLPWGRNFGFEKTLTQGHPKPHKIHADTVRRIFRDIVHMSAEDLAIALTNDGAISPDGDTIWGPSTILFIVKNWIYIGRIRYRKTTIKKIRKSSKTASLTRLKKPRKYVVTANPEYTWVIEVNEDFRIVSDDIFQAANLAVKARTYNRKRTGPISDPALPIFGSPKCNLAHPFEISRAAEGNYSYRYKCSLGKACQCVSRSLPADPVEEAIYHTIVPFLSNVLDGGFIDSFRTKLVAKSQKFHLQKSELNNQLETLNEEYRTIMRSEMFKSFIPEEVEREAALVDEKRRAIHKSLSAVPRISVEKIDFDGTEENLRAGFELLSKRLPFIPNDLRERNFVEALHKGVREIRILRDPEKKGVVQISIYMQWQRYFLTQEELAVCGFAPQELSTEIILPFHYTSNGGTMALMSELAAGGLHALSDEEWDVVKRELPDLRKTDHNGDRPTATRTVVHCLLFLLRTVMPLSAIPTFFGHKTDVYNAILRFVAAGGVETLVCRLGEHDPKWLEGLDLGRLANLRRAADYSRVARVQFRPAETAARLLRDGNCVLNDDVWNAIEHVFDPRIQKPTGREGRSMDCRLAMEGIFIKLRSHCAWGKMPGSLRYLHQMAMAIAYHGAWDAALEILQCDHPHTVADIDARAMNGFPRSIAVRRQRRVHADI